MRALALVLTLLAAPFATQAEEVDVELFLAVDVSRSMTLDELEIQRQGYANAITSPDVMDAIRRGLIGTIAVTYVEWAGENSQKVIVPWTRVSTLEDAVGIAAIITADFETPLRRTSISAALLYARESIETNDFKGLRRVIDVSGDGPNNMGAPVHIARDTVLAGGIIINGLPIMAGAPDEWSLPDLDAYYSACVTGGPGSFVLPVHDWADFAGAVRRKLILEIAARPAPPRPRLIRAAGYNCYVGEAIWEQNTRRYWDY